MLVSHSFPAKGLLIHCVLHVQVGMSLEPGGLKDQLVTAAGDGEMKLLDFRMLGENASAPASGGTTQAGGNMGVWKTVHASQTSKNLSALAVHPNAPLLATGTATQVNALDAFLPCGWLPLP